ncbi:MAG: heavy-metal-associated domain-containing protein [Bellilinea sp.]
MNSKSLTQLSLPVHGMSCTGCAAHVEKAISQLPGVSQVKVDLKAEVANITYDPHQVDLLEFQHAISQVGYKVPTAEITLTVKGMSCLSCSSHVGGALGDLTGVLQANVNLDKGTAQVTYVPELVSSLHMEEAVREAGYQASAAEQPDLPSEHNANQVTEKTETAHGEKFTWRFKSLLKRS